MIKDEWRITTAAIQLEMERIAGLLQKSVHFQSRTSAPHPSRERGTITASPTSRREGSSHRPATQLAAELTSRGR
ncbi:MAG TPA: hypothetical protein VF018_10085 [Acidobacteriaceae bacterium]